MVIQLRTRPVLLILALSFLVGLPGCMESVSPQPEVSPRTRLEEARHLARKILILDTHVDVPDRLNKAMENISVPTEGGDFDYPRARAGGLDAPFMSIYVPAHYQDSGGAKAYADHLIDMVEEFEDKWPEKFVVTRSVSEVRAAFASGRIGLPMGMENGAPVQGDLANLKHFHRRGIRYITLTHSRVNHISDSSYDPIRRWNGLSPFGREVVREMNRLGIMIDVSHLSDEAFEEVLDLSIAPVIASHSSCRHFTPGWERNMSDEMIRRLAASGGVIQIAFGSSFIDDGYRLRYAEREQLLDEHLRQRGLTRRDARANPEIRRFLTEHPLSRATVAQVADHFDRVRTLVGVDHVGFGSDFDGVADTTPKGLRDVSQYPNLLAELLARGYSQEELEKICSGNLLRVWSAVEETAARLQAGS